MTSPILRGRNANQDLYVRALTSAYSAGFRLYDPDLALARDADIYDKIRRDPVVMSAMETRLHSVAGKRWRVEANRTKEDVDKKAAAIMESLWTECTRFSEARYLLALASIFSSSFGFMEGERRFLKHGDDTVERDWWAPNRIKNVDRRRFRRAPKWTMEGTRRKLHVEEQLWSVELEQWLPLEHPEWFVRHLYTDEESRLGYGRGLLEAIYVFLHAKEIVLREGLQGLERWAQGFVVVRVDGSRDAASGKPNTAIVSAWKDVIKKARAKHGIVADKLDEVTFAQPGGQGHQMVKEFLAYLDDAIRSLITGMVLAQGGGTDVGSNARSETELDVSEMLLQYDRNLLDETLTRDAMRLTWDLNRPQLVAAGLGDARMPRFSTVQEHHEDPEVAARVLKDAMAAGMRIREDEAYRKIGYSVPQKDDAVLEPQAAFGEFPGIGSFGVPGVGAEGKGALPGAEGEKGQTVGTTEDEAATINELTLAIERLMKVGDKEMINNIRREIARRLGVTAPADLEVPALEPEPVGAAGE